MAINFRANAAKAEEDRKSNLNIAPAGNYFLTVVDAEEMVSKAGNDMIKLEYVVSSAGPYKDKTRVWHYLTLLPVESAGHGMTLHALGCHGFDNDGDLTISARDFIGRTVQVKLDQEPYEGKVKNIIKKFIGDAETPAASKKADPDQPEWVDEGTAAGAARTAAATRPAATPARKLPWGKR